MMTVAALEGRSRSRQDKGISMLAQKPAQKNPSSCSNQELISRSYMSPTVNRHVCHPQLTHMLTIVNRCMSPTVNKHMSPTVKDVSPTVNRHMFTTVNRHMSPTVNRSMSPTVKAICHPQLTVFTTVNRHMSPSVNRHILTTVNKCCFTAQNVATACSDTDE